MMKALQKLQKRSRSSSDLRLPLGSSTDGGEKNYMPVKNAVHSFTNERLNCAQSILKAFREKKNVSSEQVADARKLGGGKADGGTCGALHAALSLLDDTEKKESVRKSFVEVAGSDRCREIRAKSHISCLQCVEIAARFLEKTDK
jgi:hypothetical protein